MSVFDSDAHLQHCLKTPINLDLFGPNANQNEQSSLFGGSRSIMGQSSLFGYNKKSSNLSSGVTGSFFQQSDLYSQGRQFQYPSDEEIEESENLEETPRVPEIEADRENFGECAITHETVFADKPYRKCLKCNAYFLPGFIDEWRQENNTCPSCGQTCDWFVQN